MTYPDSWKNRQVLLTGSTGFIGREQLLRLIEAGVPKVYVLIRGSEEERNHKLDKALSAILPDEDQRKKAEDRITILPGDISDKRLGLSKLDWDQCVSEVNHIIHCAANVRFSDTVQHQFQNNLGGTRHALDLAEAIAARGNLAKFDYVGTAYVAGDREGFIRESELDMGQGFNNAYEESKFHSEKEVLLRAKDMPFSRFRPSVVVGDQSSGRTSNFMMIYWLVKIYADGWWRTIPYAPDTVVDIIPVNFVVDAIMHISTREESHGKAFHLAAGPHNSSSVDELCDLVEKFFNGRPIIKIPFDTYTEYIGPLIRMMLFGKLKRLLTNAKVYEPYFKMRKLFDTEQTELLLEGSGLASTPVRDYFNTLFKYCVETDWGKKVAGKSRD